MTGIVLVGIVSGWVVFIAYCGIKDSSAVLQGRNGTVAFNRSLGALSEASAASTVGQLRQAAARGSAGSIGSGRAILNHPRSSREAGRRRRRVMIGLAVIAAAALVSTLAIGAVGWVVHIAADLALLCFVTVAARQRHLSAENEMRAMLLNHGQPVAVAARSAAVAPAAAARPAAVR